MTSPLLLFSLVSIASAACPPTGWTCAYPPTAAAPCCSQFGFLGNTAAHCTNGGFNSVALGCCSNSATLGFTCIDDRAPPPPTTPCTGIAALDLILNAANLPVVTQMYTSQIYRWEEFCSVLRTFNSISSLPVTLGSASTNRDVAIGLVNLAGLLSQTMFETGADVPFLYCDEVNFSNSPTASCTQRIDGQLYANIQGDPRCAVDLNMRMTAVSSATFNNAGPLSCVPGTATRGCCWWGRGAIQTTGPANYKALQLNYIDRTSLAGTVDLCTNPEAICQVPGLAWPGAMTFWSSVVQTQACFESSRNRFIDSNFDFNAVVDGCFNTFARGISAVVNNGNWFSTADGQDTRVLYFRRIVTALINSGMSNANTPVNVSPSRTPTSSTTTTASATRTISLTPTRSIGTTSDPTTTRSLSASASSSATRSPAASPSATSTRTRRCPPDGWTCSYPPPASAPCCSRFGFLGNSDAHCLAVNGGLDSVALSCCSTTNSGGFVCLDDSTPTPTASPSVGTLKCPPDGWTCVYPPPQQFPCCSRFGFLGDLTSDAHCLTSNGGFNSIALGCCAVTNSGLSCLVSGVTQTSTQTSSVSATATKSRTAERTASQTSSSAPTQSSTVAASASSTTPPSPTSTRTVEASRSSSVGASGTTTSTSSSSPTRSVPPSVSSTVAPSATTTSTRSVEPSRTASVSTSKSPTSTSSNTPSSSRSVAASVTRTPAPSASQTATVSRTTAASSTPTRTSAPSATKTSSTSVTKSATRSTTTSSSRSKTSTPTRSVSRTRR